MLRTLATLSDGIARVERLVVRVLVIALPLMILANATGRALRMPIYWMDELAILTMVCMAMLCMSLTLKTREAVAVTMLVDAVPPGLMKAMKIVVDALILAFGLVLLVLCYRWFDPVTLMRLGFDTREFSGQTFNFMYQDTTTTLGVNKFWFWLVLPFSAFNTSVHALANFLHTVSAPAAGQTDAMPAPVALGAE